MKQSYNKKKKIIVTNAIITSVIIELKIKYNRIFKNIKFKCKKENTITESPIFSINKNKNNINNKQISIIIVAKT